MEGLMNAGSGGVKSEDVTANRSMILSGYTALTSDSEDDPISGTMPDRGAVSITLQNGGSYGIPYGCHNGGGSVRAKTRKVHSFGDISYQIVSSRESFIEPAHDETFIMPANGVVRYSGYTIKSHLNNGTAISEIYRNGSLVDNRNINPGDSWLIRGSMVNKSFSANAGDAIRYRVSTSGTAGGSTSASMHVVCIWEE